jgi:hypothetical protein
MLDLDDSPVSIDEQKPAITLRSVLLGLIAVVLVCAVTPFNDYVLSNTSLTAGFMPLGMVLILFVLVVGINGTLHRWFPRRALGTGELAIIVLMTLVACSLPNWGMMRFLVPMPVTPFHMGARDELFWNAFTGMNLPTWLFPAGTIQNGRTSPIIEWFFNRVPAGGAIPWGAWLMPLAGWGVFAGAMMLTLASLARLVLDQWALNERLPFPIAQVQTALIEPPEPGFALNRLFRDPVLWIGLCGVLGIQLLSILNTYFPTHVPVVSLKFDLSGILSEEPFIYLRPRLKKSFLSFTVVGMTYFIRSRAAFSLWATFVVLNLIDMEQGMRQADISPAAYADQHLGACVAFVLGITWVGRHYWLRVVRNAFGGGGDRGGDRSGRASFWLACVGVATMLGWLSLVGTHLYMAVMIVGFIVMGQLVVARVVAETGMTFFRTSAVSSQVYTNTPAKWYNTNDIYFGGVFTLLGAYATREGLTTLATTGLVVCKNAGVAARNPRRIGWVIALALGVGFAVAACTTLWCQYSYPTPAAQTAIPQRNYFGAEAFPQREIGAAVDQFGKGRFAPKEYNSPLHMGIGFGVTALLEAASLRWASWPFLPVGFVASYGTPIGDAWFSIFVGWLAQLLIVRFGGARFYQRAKPFFIGLIFGEGLAAGIWIIVNAVIVLNGGASQSVKFIM